jgi:hypothetical protein
MHFQKFLNFLGINLCINLVCLKIATEAKKESYTIKTLLKTNCFNLFNKILLQNVVFTGTFSAVENKPGVILGKECAEIQHARDRPWDFVNSMLGSK